MKKTDTQAAISSRLTLNRILLSLSVTIFALIITFNSGILEQNLFLTTQLIISIPLLLSSTLSNITAQEQIHVKEWVRYASTMYILGYAFLNNVIGILIATQISIVLGVVFFIVNWGLALAYSYRKVSLGARTWAMRLRKDLLFIGLQIIFGLLPAIGIFRT